MRRRRPRRGGPRHAAPEPGSGRHPGRWLAAGAAVLAVAVAVVLVVGPGREDDGGPTSPAPAASSAARLAPDALVDWVRTQLPAGGTVTAEPELRTALTEAGVDPAVLPESGADGDAGAPALVLTGAPPGTGRVLARFDRPGEAGPLLLVDPAPVEPTDEERERREALAAAVLANPTTAVEGDSRAVLESADVDARLLSLVAALTAREGVGLWSFPLLPGEEPGAAPARRVVVDSLGGRPIPADGATTQRLVAWLDAQLAPFAPDVVEVTGEGVLVAFAYLPGPDAVVGEVSP
ncbi:hypothetical protein DQ240_15940 [Blastococcus sp. TF02A-26]|nr:hypothetical protein DQ240_15940 [Blastococcus sp. TF02A-26]